MMMMSPFYLSIIFFFFISLILRSILTVHSHDQREFHRKISLRPTLQEGNTLHVRPGSSFKIAVFADLHFGEDAWTEWGPQQDVNSIKVMSTVLDLQHPDLVVYLGDVVTANNIAIHNASLYWDQAISPTRDRGIPWASVFGNHDDMPFEWSIDWFSSTGIPPLHCPTSGSSPSESEGGKDCSFKGTTRLGLMMNELKMNNLSYSKLGPKALWPSISNYVLKLSSTDDPESVIAYMYFLDSGGGSYPEVISNAQAKWFNRTSQAINPNSSVPEIIFWHIPSQAYKTVAPRFDAHRNCIGSMFAEEVASQEAEMGMMKLLEGRSSVKAVFVGHNHGLDWCCPYKKLWLCYARHTGYGGYGNWSRGARILEITTQRFSLKSRIHMEDGSVHSEVLLSSTASEE
ncbi:putative inactive purple acid phosphatase 16 [Capsicum chinense]|nr:putative inactive purple acid phosphatase 16 [Capsicum chinense]